MRRWVKVTLGILAGLIVLLVLNSIAVTSQTEEAERNIEGAELIETANGTLQVLDQPGPGGSPIVLLHGATCSINWWQDLAPLLAEGHRVIGIDLLGHGGSEKPKSGYEITDQANAVAEALAKLGVADATIVGHSLGASVAAAVAEQSPDLARAIVNIDQAPDDSYAENSFLTGVGTLPLIGPALQRAVDVAPTSFIRDRYELAFAPGFNIASGFENPDQVVDDLREMTYDAFVDVIDADDSYLDARPLDERLSALGVPVLVIFGAEDQIYDPAEAIQPYRDIPGFRTELIADAGHSPHVEKPEELATLITAFAERPTPEERREVKEAARRAQGKAAAAEREGPVGGEGREKAKATTGWVGGGRPAAWRRWVVSWRVCRDISDQTAKWRLCGPYHRKGANHLSNAPLGAGRPPPYPAGFLLFVPNPRKTKGPVTRALRLGPASRPFLGLASRPHRRSRLAASPLDRFSAKSDPGLSCD